MKYSLSWHTIYLGNYVKLFINIIAWCVFMTMPTVLWALLPSAMHLLLRAKWGVELQQGKVIEWGTNKPFVTAQSIFCYSPINRAPQSSTHSFIVSYGTRKCEEFNEVFWFFEVIRSMEIRYEVKSKTEQPKCTSCRPHARLSCCLTHLAEFFLWRIEDGYNKGTKLGR